MNLDLSKTVKIILVILFFLCLLQMPYGFYQLVRLVCPIGFAILAYQANSIGKQTTAFNYLCLAILFQPFFKIPLGREIWNIVDVIVGVGLILSIFIKPRFVRG